MQDQGLAVLCRTGFRAGAAAVAELKQAVHSSSCASDMTVCAGVSVAVVLSLFSLFELCSLCACLYVGECRGCVVALHGACKCTLRC